MRKYVGDVYAYREEHVDQLRSNHSRQFTFDPAGKIRWRDGWHPFVCEVFRRADQLGVDVRWILVAEHFRHLKFETEQFGVIDPHSEALRDAV